LVVLLSYLLYSILDLCKFTFVLVCMPYWHCIVVSMTTSMMQLS
jgi:hypothetical protein